MDLDLAASALELIEAIRGSRTQKAASQLVGVSNVVFHKWESGKSRMPWAQFVALCAKCNINLDAALSNLMLGKNMASRPANLFKKLTGSTTLSQMAETLKMSRFRLGRLINGNIEPTLEEVLRLIHEGANMLVDFIEVVAPAAKLPSLDKLVQLTRLQRHLYATRPEIYAIQRCFSLTQYKQLSEHSDAVIVACTGFSLAVVQSAISQLEKADLIKKVGNKYILSPYTERNNLNPSFLAKNPQIRSFFQATAHDKNSRTDNSGGALQQTDLCQVISVSPKTEEQIRELFTSTFQSMSRLIVDDQDQPDRILLLLAQAVSLNHGQL